MGVNDGILAGMGVVIIFALFAFLLVAALITFIIVVNWKTYEKAGKPGWASLVPVYNIIVLLEIIGYKWYYVFCFLLNFILPPIGPIAFLVFSISYNIKLAKSFGQSIGFGIGLCFLSPIFLAIIAFNKDIKYIGPSVNGDIDFNDMF